MYLKYVDSNNTTKTYDEIKHLVFSPEVQSVSNELIINEFTADIVTSNTFETGKIITLYDENDMVWAKYFIAFAEKADADTVQVIAKSILHLLDKKTLPAVIYSNESVVTVLQDMFAPYVSIYGHDLYSLDNVFVSETLTGYCPEQTARERLQWICFTIGAYVNTCFTDRLDILQVDITSSVIPPEHTFWRPSVTYHDVVTHIKVTSYEYTQGTPSVTDDWVEVGGVTYIQSYYEHYLANPDAPQDAPDNIYEVSDLTLINESNYATVLANLGAYYFAVMDVSAEILDDGEYVPGNVYTVDTGFMMVKGFLKSAEFLFGHGKKARATFVQALERASGILTIRYMLNGVTEIDRNERRYPLATAYSITNPWLDRWIFGGVVRRVYYPEYEAAEGTMMQQYVTSDQLYHIAAQYRITNGELQLENIDNAVLDAQGVLWIE